MNRTDSHIPRLPKIPYPFRSLENCFVAGGAILSAVTKTEPADYDIYPKSRDAVPDILDYLIGDEGCYIINVSDRAITLKSNIHTDKKKERVIVQVMMLDATDTPQKIFEYFDFTVTMGAFDADSKTYHFHPDFFVDVAAKTIRFNPKTRYPFASMVRLIKYRAKGFYLSKSEMMRMSLTLMQTKLPESWKDLQKAIGGVYGRQIDLSVGDEEFTMNRAIEILDVIDFDDLMFLEEGDFSSMTVDDFTTVLSKTPMFYGYANVPSIGQESRKFIVNKNGNVLSTDAHRILKLAEIYDIQIPKVDEKMVLRAYKHFLETPEGKLRQNSFAKETFESDCSYNFPTFVHVYSRPVNTLNHKNGVYRILFHPEDVSSLSDGSMGIRSFTIAEKVD